MAAAAGLETPFKPAGGDDCASKSYTARRLKPSWRRCFMTVILAIFVYASVFSQPVMRCYQNVAHKLSHDSMSFGQPKTFEQRARRVLSKTPLIGMANNACPARTALANAGTPKMATLTFLFSFALCMEIMWRAAISKTLSKMATFHSNWICRD
jgi:hypothetical protein